MPEKQIFEIPQQLRELAQKNVEQARAAYGQFMDAMAQAVSAWSSASSDTVTSAFKAVQDGAIRFAKENAEAGFALANELTKAKDLQDVLRLQSSFAQKQMESYARQAQNLAGSWPRPPAARCLRAEHGPQATAKQRSKLYETSPPSRRRYDGSYFGRVAHYRIYACASG